MVEEEFKLISWGWGTGKVGVGGVRWLLEIEPVAILKVLNTRSVQGGGGREWAYSGSREGGRLAYLMRKNGCRNIPGAKGVNLDRSRSILTVKKETEDDTNWEKEATFLDQQGDWRAANVKRGFPKNREFMTRRDPSSSERRGWLH